MEIIIGILVLGFFMSVFEKISELGEGGEKKPSEKQLDAISRQLKPIDQVVDSPAHKKKPAEALRSKNKAERKPVEPRSNPDDARFDIEQEKPKHKAHGNQKATAYHPDKSSTPPVEIDLDQTLPMPIAMPRERTNTEKAHAKPVVLSPSARKIETIVKSRSINELIHFTRYENLESILKNGLITRDLLSSSAIKNDELRLDEHTNTVSVSISFPNYLMFYPKRLDSKITAQGWVVLTLHPQLLWDKKCAFYEHNAASSVMRRRPIETLMLPSALEHMFAESSALSLDSEFDRTKNRLETSDPTDPQAEVLVCSNIPKEYIMSVFFSDERLLSSAVARYRQQSPNVHFAMAEKYFNSRGYTRKWQTAPSSRQN